MGGVGAGADMILAVLMEQSNLVAVAVPVVSSENENS